MKFKEEDQRCNSLRSPNVILLPIQPTMKRFATLFLIGTITICYGQMLDPTFGDNGSIPFGGGNANSESNSRPGTVMEIQTDGKLVVGTSNYDPNTSDNYFYTYRYLTDGMPDPSFGNNGVSKLWMGDNSICNDLKIQSDGKIVMVGETEYCIGGVCGANQFVMLRLNPNGDLDSTFGTDGRILSEDILGTTGIYAIPYGLEILPSGQFLVAGRGENGKPFATRLNANGGIDNSFGTNGIFTDQNCPYCRLTDLLVDGNQNSYLLITEYPSSGTSNAPQIRVDKLAPTGNLSLGFGTGGVAQMIIDSATFTSSFELMSNRLAIVGKTEVTSVDDTRGYLAFMELDGMPSTLIPNGFIKYNITATNNTQFHKVKVVDGNNLLLVGESLDLSSGQFLREGLLCLVDSTGNLSAQFDLDGFMSFDYGHQATIGWNGYFTMGYDVDATNANEIFVTGTYNHTPGSTASATLLLKLHDVVYNQNSAGLTQVSGANEEVECVKIVDLMGRETNFQPNQILIYWYSDGSSKKVFVAE